mgnify:CR=1 FL=1
MASATPLSGATGRFECQGSRGPKWSLSKALDVPVAFFFEGLNGDHEEGEGVNGHNGHTSNAPPDVFSSKETIDLVRAFYNLGEEPRRRLLDLAKAMSGA